MGFKITVSLKIYHINIYYNNAVCKTYNSTSYLYNDLGLKDIH